MAGFYDLFLKGIQPSGRILDIGSGSGRDLKEFKSLGYEAIGIEPCSDLAAFARTHSGCEVILNTIQGFSDEVKFDGVWACASLLHLDNESLIIAFKNILKLLSNKGIFYCSFKLGSFEGERNSRFFNDQTLESIIKLLPRALQIEKHWITEDLRADRDEKWLNLLIKKC